MQMENLKDLYIHELRDLYSAESQILDALPKMADACKDTKLKDAFIEHLEVTKRQKSRLDEIFSALDTEADNMSCEGIKGIIKEGETLIKKDKSIFRGNVDDDVMDAALISSAQRVEHYEISGYGTVIAFAERLGFSDHASKLRQTLDEEKETDKRLTRLAESGINVQAT
jgi:ferritin-like metal-binding protein YciE